MKSYMIFIVIVMALLPCTIRECKYVSNMYEAPRLEAEYNAKYDQYMYTVPIVPVQDVDSSIPVYDGTPIIVEQDSWDKSSAFALVFLVLAHVVGYFLVVNYCIVNKEDRNAISCARAFFTSVAVGILVVLSIYFGT